MTENHLLQLDRLEGLLLVSSVNEMEEQLTKLSKELGFENFSCGVMSFGRDGQAPSVRIVSRYPADWQTHYDKCKYFSQDLVIQHTIRDRNHLPVIWPEPGKVANPVHRKIFSEAGDFGMRCGVTVNCQGANHIGVLSLSSDVSRKTFSTELVRALGQIQLVACYLQEVWNRLAQEIKPYAYQATNLTGRELECLHWAAAGKTSWEISNILCISERTVVFHIGRAVEKLGVSNRRQAVAKAVTLGLIRP